MNSFEVNTLPYIVHTLLSYKTSDRYKGFIVQVEEKPTEENNWRNRQSLMSLLSDGLGALFDHFHNRNKDKYAPDYVN